MNRRHAFARVVAFGGLASVITLGLAGPASAGPSAYMSSDSAASCAGGRDRSISSTEEPHVVESVGRVGHPSTLGYQLYNASVKLVDSVGTLNTICTVLNDGDTAVSQLIDTATNSYVGDGLVTGADLRPGSRYRLDLYLLSTGKVVKTVRFSTP